MVAKWLGARNLIFLGLIVIFGFVPVMFQGNARILNILSVFLIWAVVASAWDLSMGYAKVWSFGHIAFFAIGGYTAAMTVAHLGLPPEAAIPLGGVVAAIVGVVIAVPCLRLHGVYIAMVTFGVHLVLPTLILWQSKYTGGDPGLFGFAQAKVGAYVFSSSMPGFSYFVIYGTSLLFLFLILRIIKSPVGLAFVGLRDSEAYAKSLGVDDYKYRLVVFAVSAFIAGFMGGLYTFEDDSPVLYEIDPVGVLCGFGNILFNHQYGDAALIDLADLLEDLSPQIRC
ncbi:MAG: branched-chain amino acid ABC transporter permease [Candidatus Marsarchaeota archaeon]|nr:branched-chain amino acid ABC transporter permease [Candidatus Marsarchaeota archaeon]